MKRFSKGLIGALLCVALLIPVCAVTSSAESVFRPLGEFEISWYGDAAKGITFDGNLDDWRDLGFDYVTITRDNLVTWAAHGIHWWDTSHAPYSPINDRDYIPEDFSINAYIGADADYLYVAFFIRDKDFALGNNAAQYNGDAFQIAVDWNCTMQSALEGGVDYGNNKNVFYSFCCLEEGGPLNISVEEGYKNRVLVDGEFEDEDIPSMRGCASSYEGGWCAEFCLSWELLYQDMVYKTDSKQLVLFDNEHTISLGLSICYINRTENAGEVDWAAGTFNATSMPDWAPTHNGAKAILRYNGQELNCEGISTDPEAVSRWEAEHRTETSTESESEPATDSQAPVATESKAPTGTKAPAGSETTAEKSGCKSVIGVGSVAVIATLACGAVLTRKKRRD